MQIRILGAPRRIAWQALVSLALAGSAFAARAAESCPGGRDLVLTNGTILTVDAADRTVSTVRIRDKRILAVGEAVNRKEPCVQIVDLGGRTVIPGLIDNHTHFVRTAQAPGPFVEGLESATSIAALQAAFAAAAKKAEPGEWVTAIGGFTPIQFAERRLPTREELSAAVPDHPVYIQVGYSTRGVVNDAGRRALEAAGIPTSEAGDVKPDGDGLTFVLRSTNEERMKRRFPDYMNYAVSLGLTTVVDHACCDWLGAHLTTADRPNMAIADYFWRAGQWPLRLRFQYDHRDTRDQSNIRSADGAHRERDARARRRHVQGRAFRRASHRRRCHGSGGARRLPAHRRRGLGAVAAHDSAKRKSNATSRSWSRWPRRLRSARCAGRSSTCSRSRRRRSNG